MIPIFLRNFVDLFGAHMVSDPVTIGDSPFVLVRSPTMYAFPPTRLVGIETNPGPKSKGQAGSGMASMERSIFTEPLKKSFNPIRGRIAPSREVKYLDIASASYAADTTGTITPLNLIAEGDDNVNRNGREVQILSATVDGFVLPNGTSTQSTQHRLLLVWDNASNGVVPAITDILTAANTVAFPNVSNIKRFTILADVKHVTGPYLATAFGDGIIAPYHVGVKIDSDTRYLGTSGAQASLGNGGLYMITLGSAPAGAGANTFTLATRVAFLDRMIK